MGLRQPQAGAQWRALLRVSGIAHQPAHEQLHVLASHAWDDARGTSCPASTTSCRPWAHPGSAGLCDHLQVVQEEWVVGGWVRVCGG